MATQPTQPLHPEMAKLLGTKYWNRFAIQLGHWNPMKVIIMDDEMFQLIPNQVKVEIAREMVKYLDEEVMYARDADNSKVWILGPKKVMDPSITMVGDVPVWDPKKKHVPVEVKIPRPPNAYILYRRDKHNKVKAENPNLHNNEISVITGAMWKGEPREVRAEYHQKAMEIKAHLMAIYPDYRYTPRKPSEIRRRASRRPFQRNPHLKPEENNKRAGLSINSAITRRIPGAQQFLPPVEEPGWTPYHLLSKANTENSLIEDAPVEDAPVEDIPDGDAPQLGMTASPEFAVNDASVGNWDIDAQMDA
ncbi:hypothetical protein VTK56DRAFT_6337 [Thermocarpiscus australiensis]